jgi:two-component system chemotaxis response regulator CheY
MSVIHGPPANDVRPNVMLVDDDDCLRDALALLLEQRGYRVDCCSDAEDALAQLAQESQPDLIVLDLIMPRMSGWEFRVKQRQVPRLAGIPLIVLSGDTSVQAEAIDADAYLAKPVEQGILLETVENVLKARLRAPSPGEQVAALRAFAARFGRTLTDPLAFTIGNLELAQGMANELRGRLKGPEAFSMVGLGQLLSRVQRGAERIASLTRDLSACCRFGPELTRRWQCGTHKLGPSLPSDAARSFPSVLVVDDEPMVCDTIAAILGTGYNVATFTDPRAALASMLQGSFDVILCDLTMSGISGIEIYEQLARQRPALADRIIFLCTGNFPDRVRGFLANTSRPQLHKPFQREDLVHMIDAHLAAR